MSEQKRTVLAIVAVAFILGSVFFVPWRIKASDELRWAPIYRQPISYSQSYGRNLPSSQYTYDTAEIAIGAYLLQLLAIGVVGGSAFRLSSGLSKGDRKTPE